MDKPTRTVGFVAYEIAPTTPGGAGVLLSHVVRVCLRDGLSVVLMLDIDKTAFDRFMAKDRHEIYSGGQLRAYHVGTMALDFPYKPDDFPSEVLFRSLRFHYVLEKVRRLEQIDLVEFFDYCGPAYYPLLMRSQKSPTIGIRLHNTIEVIDTHAHFQPDANRLFIYALERGAMRLADILIAPSRSFFAAEYLRRYDLDSAAVEISPPPCLPIGKVKRGCWPNAVLFYGRLSKLKGVDTFINAALRLIATEQVPEHVEFICIGPGEHVTSGSQDEFRKMVPDELASRFHFPGRISHDQLAEYLGRAICCVFPNRTESYCYAAHEIYMAKVPLILNDIPAFRDFFEDGRDALFFKGTAIDLSHKIARLLSDQTLAKGLSQRVDKRLPDYQANHYVAHLKKAAALTAAQPAAGRRPTLTVLVLPAAGADTVKSVKALSEQADVRAFGLVEAAESGAFPAFGTRWQVIDQAGAELCYQGLTTSEALMFVKAGDGVDPEFLRQALDILRDHKEVGVVGSWLKTPKGVLQRFFEAGHSFANVLVGETEPQRVVLRSVPDALLHEAAGGQPWQADSDLIGYWADKRMAVSLPVPLVQIGTSQVLRRVGRPSAAAPSIEGQRLRWLDMTRQDPELAIIHCTGRRNPASHGNEVWVVEPFTDGLCVGEWRPMEFEFEGKKTSAVQTFAGHVLISASQPLAVLSHSYSGEIEIFHRGQASLFDLYHPKSRILRLSAKQMIAGTDTLERLWQEPGKELDAETMFLVRGLQRRNAKHIAVTQTGKLHNDVAAYFDAAIKIGGGDEQNRALQYARLYALCGAVDLDSVTFVGAEEAQLSVLHRLISDFPHLKVGLLIQDYPFWRDPGTAEAGLASWLQVTRTYPERVSVLSGTENIAYLFDRAGARSLYLPPVVPASIPERVGGGGEILRIGVVAHPRYLGSVAHMLGGAWHYHVNTRRVAELEVCGLSQEERDILSMLGAHLSVKPRAQEDALDPAWLSRQDLVLCIYPDGDRPAVFRAAAAVGVPCLVGPVTDNPEAEPLAEYFNVNYWEDTSAIADAIHRICCDPQQTAQHLRDYCSAAFQLRHTVLNSFVDQLASGSAQTRAAE